jgi:uroporphyrinogen decarboxylase
VLVRAQCKPRPVTRQPGRGLSGTGVCSAARKRPELHPSRRSRAVAPAAPRLPVPDAGTVGGVTVLEASPFLAACKAQPVEHTPVWFMRQAGRSLPEYRRARGSESILDAIRNPELAAEITLQPVRRYGVDAAILFSDIVAPVAATGFGIDIVSGVGPVADNRFEGAGDLARIQPLVVEEHAPWLTETVRILSSELSVPLIGFAGAPFTVASYLIEGRPSRDYLRTKTLMAVDPGTWFELLDRLADQAIASLRAQVEAGASAVQLFDSWVGALDPRSYRRYVLPATRKIFAAIQDLGVPRIHFGVGTGELLSLFVESGADVVGVDWRVALDVAYERTGGAVALQGNLDPATCIAGWDVAKAAAEVVLDDARRGPLQGHVFNLGHGVLPETDPDVLARVVDLVHESTLR